jgi:hypothetical protein
MKLKEGFVLSKAGEEYVAVATGEAGKSFNGLVRNNATAAFLLNKLKKECSEEDLVNALLEEYEVSRENAEKDVKNFVKIINDAGMLA